MLLCTAAALHLETCVGLEDCSALPLGQCRKVPSSPSVPYSLSPVHPGGHRFMHLPKQRSNSRPPEGAPDWRPHCCAA